MATTPNAFEAGTVAGTFTITRKGNTTDPLTLTYTVTGTAVAGADYVALPGSVTIPAGVASVPLAVTPIDDTLIERDETVIVTLDANAAYLLNPAQATVTIVSDEVPPDLVIASVNAPSAAGAGDTIALTDTTRNVGTVPSGASVTSFHLSTNATLEAGDVLLGTRAIAALAAGASDTGSVNVTIPASTAAGNYWILAVADTGDALVDAQEGNNVLARAIAIGPDLVVSGLTGPADGGAGQPLSLTVTTRNQAGGLAAASTTTFYLSTDALLDTSDVVLGSRAVPPLGPGAADTGSTTMTVPAGVGPGTYYLFARADAGGVVSEISETNNTVYGGSIRIGPDLVVTSFIAPAAAGADSAITLTDTTRNLGGGAAAATTTRFHLSSNTVLDASDVPLGSRAVPALGPGASDTGSVSVTIPAGTAAGSYYLIVSADSDGSVIETQEDNNVFARAITIGADLVVTSFTTPAAAGPGSTITVTDTTQNQGGGAAGATTTRIYLSANALLDASDVALGSRAVPALGPGASHTGSVSVTIPAGTAAGLYYLIASADSDAAVGESQEGNNVLARVITIGADLVISALSGPGDSGAGQAISVSVTTRNQGASAAGASTTVLYFSTDALFDAADVALGSRAVPALGPSASDTGSVNVTIPGATAPGTYYLIARADSGEVVGETSETNNSSYWAIRVGPDLVVTSLTAPAATGAGSTITVTDTTRNSGGSAAAATTTRIYLSANAVLDASDVALGSRTVPSLAAGISNAGSINVTIPAGTAAGTYYLIANADSDGAVSESQEANNALARAITIGADLVVSSFTSSTDSGAGQAITLTDTTRNLGSSPAGNSITTYYLSTNVTLDAADVVLGSRPVPALGPGAWDTGSVSASVPVGTAPGIYYLIARADSEDVLVETSETNNLAYWTLRVGPDLVVASLNAPTAAGAGSAITVTDTTRNAGGGGAGATTTRVYLSTNTLLDAADVALGSRAVPALGAGASDTGSVSVTIPAGTAAGTYYLIASADSDGVVSESQEGNNVLARALTIGADLVVSGLSGPSDSGAGQALTLTVTTRNQGGSAAGSSTTTFYLSTDAQLDAADVVLGSRAVPALEAGALDTGPTLVTVPVGTASGTYYLFARADTGGVVVETSEVNNTVYGGSIRIGPDLVMTSLGAPATASAGSVITVTDTTRNSGGGAAAATTTRFYLSTNLLIDAADVLLGARAVAALAPGASESGSVSVTIPAGTAPGTYYLIATADGDNAVAETQEGNNWTYRSIQVTVP
ncbi:MAG: CARDB domain-containing protein [Candidatus Binatia bacterium]